MGRLVANITGYWAVSGSGPDYRIVDPWGPRSLLLMPFYFAGALAVVAWHGLRGRIALLHVNMASWGSCLRKGAIVLLGAGLGIPVIIHLHAGDFLIFHQRLPAWAGWLLRAILRRADRVVVLSEGWREALVRDLELEPRRLVVLPNALPAPRRVERPADGPCEIVFLGRLEAAKGVPELLEALADPRLRGLAWRASLVGPGSAEGYRRRAAELGLAERVGFPGWEEPEQVQARLAGAEVFVLPSHFEGLSMALLEALANGLAVVATAVGATPEVVQDGTSGLLVPPGDPAALAEALRRVVMDQALRRRLQREGRARFNDSFEISIYSQKLVALYDEVLKGHSAGT